MDTQVYCSLPWWDGPLYSHVVLLEYNLELFGFVYPMLKTVFLQDRQDTQSQIMREYNPTIRYANKDHPTMALNNILACP